MAKAIKIGIIGGSGLYNLELADLLEKKITTSYGDPSSVLKCGKLNGVEVVFINRHGLNHTIPPTQVNYRANIAALKADGCTHILATTACGSLKKEIGRGHLVILDQFIDFTKHRRFSFYERFASGQHGHTAMAEPFSKEMREALISSCQELELEYHTKGTVITIEGPRFSTKAESKMFSYWGADVINMSIAPEAALANEAKIPYAAVAMSTDYDCLFDDVTPVTHEEVLHVFNSNIGKVIKLIKSTLPKLADPENSKINLDKSKINFNSTTINNNSNNKISSLDSSDKEQSTSKKETEMDLKQFIRTVPDWPKPGVMFRDITTLLMNPVAFDYSIKKMKKEWEGKYLSKIAGIESRGFIFGAALAKELNLPFVLIRKKGKLPAETVCQEYELEYGTDKIEIHKDAISPGDRVLIVDDLLATGGTALAASKLVEKLNGHVEGISFVINLPDLKGEEKLRDYNISYLVEFSGE